MGGRGGHYAQRNKSDRETQILDDLTYVLYMESKEYNKPENITSHSLLDYKVSGEKFADSLTRITLYVMSLFFSCRFRNYLSLTSGKRIV